jgi:hypothetical protein
MTVYDEIYGGVKKLMKSLECGKLSARTRKNAHDLVENELGQKALSGGFVRGLGDIL